MGVITRLFEAKLMKRLSQLSRSTGCKINEETEATEHIHRLQN